MTVTLTYDPALARVRITADGLAAANHATIERSTDQILWTTIRGGVTASVTAGALTAAVDDYEFVAGKTNYYRVRGIETGAITFVAAGTASTAVNASVTPALPAGLVVGDLLVILASIRNATDATVNIPAGWTLIRYISGGGEPRGVALLGRRYQSGDVAPAVTFTGGVANADTFAQMAAFRRADVTLVAAASGLNGSGQDIVFPALTVPENNLLVLLVGWKPDDWTSVATVAGFTEIGETTSTAGDDAGQVWDYQIQTTKTNISLGSFTVTGGAAAASRGGTVALRHAPYLNEQTASTIPPLDQIWLKSVTRPFLNRAITVVDWTPEERASRSGAFAAVGRTLAVGVTDVAGGLAFTLDIRTATPEDAQTLDYVRSSGDVLFLHTPLGCPVPGGHVLVDTSAARRPRPRGDARVFSLPLQQIAAPGPDVVGATSTWQTVINSYPTWAALLAANPTWADLVARIAPPSEVIVA